jgi:hypothetical protein
LLAVPVSSWPFDPSSLHPPSLASALCMWDKKSACDIVLPNRYCIAKSYSSSLSRYLSKRELRSLILNTHLSGLWSVTTLKCLPITQDENCFTAHIMAAISWSAVL